METLGQRIKIIRKWRRQEDFAASLNVTRTTLASWEIGRREPDIDSLIRIADIGRVSLDWLLAGREPAATTEFAQGRNDPALNEIIEFFIFYKITPVEAMQILRKALRVKE